MEFKLIIKKINGTLSNKEKIEFDNWYLHSKKHRDYFSKVKKGSNENKYLTNKNIRWNIIKKQINSEKKPFKAYLNIAASIVVLLSVAYYTIYSGKLTGATKLEVENIKNDKIQLTLANGDKINLGKEKEYENTFTKTNGNKLVYKTEQTFSNGKSEKNTNVSYNYLTTKRGGEYCVVLSDGTKIWLNSASKLKYPTNFINGKTRTVELVYGEAYFEVSDSKNHLGAGFEVINSFQKVSVLGTHFNIKAYPEDKEVATTLKEGKVLVESSLGEKKYLLPNQQILLNKYTKEIQIKAVDVESQISWVNGYFSFESIPLSEIKYVLERWYDVDIIINDKEIEKIKFNGILNKNLELKFILNSIINTTNYISYDVKNKKIQLKKR